MTNCYQQKLTQNKTEKQSDSNLDHSPVTTEWDGIIQLTD